MPKEIGYLNQISSRILQRFGYKLTTKEVEHLKAYKDLITYFIPELLIEKRIQHDLSKNTDYTFVDFTGQNAANYYFTQIALISAKAKSIDETITLARSSEEIATFELTEEKSFIANTVKNIYGKKTKTVFSGDDGTIYAGSNKKNFIKDLAKHHSPSRFRVTWVSKDTPANLRQSLSVKGELIHKKLLLKLEKHIDYQILKDSVFGVDMSLADSPSRSVDLYISGKLYIQEVDVLRKILPNLLKDFNLSFDKIHLIN
ncbi:hypothetical protein N9W41_00145 [bacterium]|nr:hypothetical protein [bacterium]